jgi:hypothetical protein
VIVRVRERRLPVCPLRRRYTRSRISPAFVHLVNFTSGTGTGLTQVVTTSSFIFAENGDFARDRARRKMRSTSAYRYLRARYHQTCRRRGEGTKWKLRNRARIQCEATSPHPPGLVSSIMVAPRLLGEVLGSRVAGNLIVLDTLRGAHQRKIRQSVLLLFSFGHDFLAFLDKAHHTFAGFRAGGFAEERKALIMPFNLAFGFNKMLLEAFAQAVVMIHGGLCEWSDKDVHQFLGARYVPNLRPVASALGGFFPLAA